MAPTLSLFWRTRPEPPVLFGSTTPDQAPLSRRPWRILAIDELGSFKLTDTNDLLGNATFPLNYSTNNNTLSHKGESNTVCRSNRTCTEISNWPSTTGRSIFTNLTQVQEVRWVSLSPTLGTGGFETAQCYVTRNDVNRQYPRNASKQLQNGTLWWSCQAHQHSYSLARILEMKVAMLVWQMFPILSLAMKGQHNELCCTPDSGSHFSTHWQIDVSGTEFNSKVV